MLNFFYSIFSRVLLTVLYLFAIVVRWVWSFLPKRSWHSNGCFIVIGTFHNPNWFHAHVTPLSKAQVGRVILVTDHPVDSLDNMEYACPPKWLPRYFGRAIAKFVWTMVCGYRYRPDFFMAYHIFPATVTAVVAGALFRRPVCYQATSGSIEIEGGGWRADNPLLHALRVPSRTVQYLACKLVQPIDLIVVRGQGAFDYFQKNVNPLCKLLVQTGSVLIPDKRPSVDQRSIDVIYIGQLIERKRPHWIVEITEQLKQRFPLIRVKIVGVGELYEDLQKQIQDKDLTGNVELLGQRKDVEKLLLDAKIFILASRWEGVSIAMLEALASGTVPVVANVGDLSSAISHGATGFLVGERVEEFFSPISELLSDGSRWESVSNAGHIWALKNVSREVVSKRWQVNLSGLTCQAVKSVGET